MVAGSAALAAAAPDAGAAPGAGGYKSTATGQSGQVTVNSSTLPAITVTATPGNSPHSRSVSSDQVVSALQGVPTLGPSLAAAFRSTNPSGVDLVTASANADGSSAACAEVFGGDCTGQGQPVVIRVNLNSLPNTQLTSSLQNIAGATLVLTINGPTASCSSGPGGTNLHASDSTADVTASVENGTGATAIAPVQVHAGDLFSQLSSLGLPSLTSQLPLSVNITPGHTSMGNGTASATAAEIGLNSTGSDLFDIKGATATCGPINGNSGGGGGNGGGGGTGTSGTGPSSNGESPLNRIGTDEGRSSAPAEPWLALNGMP